MTVACAHLLHTYLVLTYSLTDIICAVVPGKFVLTGYCKCQVWMKQKRMVDMYTAHISSPHARAPLSCVTSHIKYKFKDKITNFRIPTLQHWVKSGSFWFRALCKLPWSWPCWSVKILCEIWSVKFYFLSQTFSDSLLCLYASESPKVIENLALTIFRSEKHEQNFWEQNLRWVIFSPTKFTGLASMHSRDKPTASY